MTVLFSIDDDGSGAPVLRLSQPSYQVPESAGSVEICVESSALLLESASAIVSTSDITATGIPRYMH